MRITDQVVSAHIARCERSKTAPKVIGGYFGTREADLFFSNQKFMKKLKRCSAFVDVTAGTGQFPLALHRRGVPIGMIDRCLYISSLFRAWADPTLPNKVGTLADLTARWVQGPPPGEYSRVKAYLGEVVSPDVGRFIEHVATRCDDPLTTHCLGRAINKHFTYRGRGFVTTAADKRPTTAVTVEEVLCSMLSQANRILLVNRGLDFTKAAVWGTTGDSHRDLRRVPRKLIQNAMVYMDTAWPYSRKFAAGANPYEFYWNKLDPIIAGGRPLPKVAPSWTINTPVDEILTAVAKIAGRAFDLGARYFVLCSQSTNYPDPHEVFERLSTFGAVKLMSIVEVGDYSTNAKYKYANYWAFFRRSAR